jgi:hypothetical protein
MDGSQLGVVSVRSDVFFSFFVVSRSVVVLLVEKFLERFESGVNDGVDGFDGSGDVPGGRVPGRVSWPEVFYRSCRAIDKGGVSGSPGSRDVGAGSVGVVPRDVEVPVVDVDAKLEGFPEQEDDDTIWKVYGECE